MSHYLVCSLILGLLFLVTPVSVSAEKQSQPSLEQANTVTASFDKSGRLWLAWVVAEHLYVNYSDDLGKHFSPPTQVNAIAQKITAHGESRPQIAVANNGHIYLVYNQKLAKRFSGHVRFSRSIDGGKTFSRPVIINSDQQEIGHSFGTLAVNRQGHIYITWLDGRDASAAQKQGRDYIGSSLYYSVSFDGGKTFQPNQKLRDHSCPCCRIAVALDNKGLPVMVWRQIFDNTIRDHALIRFTGAMTFAPMRRASQDNWAIDACPHHGPALSIAADDSYHLTWFTGAVAQAGIYYARSDNSGQNFYPSLKLGNPAAQAQHPFVLSRGNAVFIVWKEFDADMSRIQMMHSQDGGFTWSNPRTLADTRDESDHPFLIASGESVYLSWQSKADGYRLIALEEKAR